VEEAIIPRYDGFDKGHQRDHAEYVIAEALNLSGYYDVDLDMIYAAAAFHDIGLCEDRKTHHIISAKIVREDKELMEFFSPEQIEIIADAAEDHRASSDHEPRTIYGKIIAEADRQIVPEVVFRRTVQFGMKHYPELDKEGHWMRTVQHLEEKYAERGYLKLWIPESPNARRLEELRTIIRDKDALRKVFEPVYKEEIYKDILPKAKSLVEGENDIIANMANLSALIHQSFGLWWTGFYRVSGDELVLGPFQGPIACTRIPCGKGVCGSAWQRKETVVVPDVEKFPGHIACSSQSRSEIVVPVWNGDRIIALMDIDSETTGTFDETDKKFLEDIVGTMSLS